MESKKLSKRKIKKTTNPSYECKIYIVGWDEKNSKMLKYSSLLKYIKKFQANHRPMIDVRIERTKYLHGREVGHVVSAINHPKIQIDSAVRPENIKAFLHELAKKILIHFNQRIITVVDDYETTMYEQEI